MNEMRMYGLKSALATTDNSSNVRFLTWGGVK